jgi:ArsR family transcriptional regulator, arsenate/arsenite/antimonite-responsive transcriptional repressor
MQLFFKALGDQTRRDILNLLLNRDLTAGEIADNFPVSKPTISHHLEILTQAGLIAFRKQGQSKYYTLNTTIFDELIQWLLSLKNRTK